MFKILFFKILCVFICYAETGTQLKNPITNVYDFSYQNNINESIQNFKREQTLDKVLIQVGKQTITTRRDNYVFSCLNDSLGSVYCPAALAPANKYSTYKEAVVIEKEASVIDYEKGSYQELTSTVRDFVNGTSSPHTNIEVNYLNGTSSSYTTGVIDYTNKENGLDSSSYTPSLAKPLIIGSNSVSINFNNRGDTGHNLNAFTCGSVVMMNGSCIDSQGNYGGRSGWGWNSNVNMFDITVPSTIEGTPSLKYDNDLVGWSNNGGCSLFSRNILEPAYNNLLINKWIIKTTSVLDGSAISTPQIINGQCKINVKAYEATYTQNTNKFIIKGYSGTGIPYTSLGNIVANNINLYTQDNNFYINGINITAPDTMGFYTSVFVNIFFEYAGKLEYQPCPSTYAFFDGKCISQSIKQKCPTGYSDNGTNCKKNVMYNFYSYGCPSGYSPKNSGFTTFTKTDPDSTIINDYTLDDDVNSATPPANNCVQTLYSTAYEYVCSSGYTPITIGQTSCPTGTSGNCNNSIPPEANCYKDISYKHYTYGCSSGYITDNYGLSTCSKTDPDTTKNNSATLDDDCNSPTPPDGNCYKQYSYKFYEYKCTGINAYNEPWIATNPGLTSCTKTDTNINAVNANLSTACNSSTAPLKNCVAAEYNCGEGDGGIYLKDIVEYIDGSSSKQTSSFVNYSQKITTTQQCPSGYTITTGIEREKGECKLETSYTYFNYSCPTEVNQFGFSYEPLNIGGNCNATNTQQLIDTNNDGISDSCNSSVPPTKNCVRKSFNAIPGNNSPVFVDNQWQCSPFSCNSNRKCGYGSCPSGTIPSDKLFQDPAYNPLGTSHKGNCIGEICDYVKNDNISYCISQGCPNSAGFINKDGNCYKEECPKGSFQSGDKCISSSY